MDTRIPLGVQQPDFVNTLARSTQAAGQANAVQDQNALRQLFNTQGPQIMQGDQNALNALSQIDPNAALGIQGARQGMQAQAQLMEQRRVEAKRQAEEYARTADAREAAAAAAEIEQGLMRGIAAYQAGDLNGVNQILTQAGEQPISDLNQFPAVAAIYGDVFDTLKGVTEFNAGSKEPASLTALRLRAIEGGLIPDTPEYMEFMRTGGKQPAQTTVNVDTGGGSKLYETLDKKQGEMFAALIEQGAQVPQNIALIDEMERILGDQNTPEGMAAALQYTAGQFGVPTEGLDALQAVDAIINRLVPQQRQPGSGPMSDADLALFQRSLPRLINTRQGNLIIARTMRGLAKYQQGQAAIAASVANREMTPADARKALSELENPLQAFKTMANDKPSVVGGGIDIETQSLIDKYAGD
jgi:hypothetical protein